jgi:hypothetical protein
MNGYSMVLGQGASEPQKSCAFAAFRSSNSWSFAQIPGKKRGKNWFNTFQLTSVVGRKNHKIAISLNQEDQWFIILGQEHLRSICGAIQAAGLSDV